MNALRAGLSGCLMSAEEHRALLVQDDCELVALHDDDPALLAACAQRTGIAHCAPSYGELLTTGIDFVVLRSAVALAQRVHDAAEQGAHVLVHHDAADDVEELARAVAACDDHEVRFGFCAPGLHDPALHDLRALLANGAIGALTELHIVGNAKIAACVPLAAWLTGRPARQVRAGVTAASGQSATLMLAQDVVVQLACGPAAPSSVIAHCTEGWCVVEPGRVGVMTRKPWHGDVIVARSPAHEEWLDRSEAAETDARRRAEPHGAFARWIEERDVFPCPGEQFVEDVGTLRALQAARRSGAIEPVQRR